VNPSRLSIDRVISIRQALAAGDRDYTTIARDHGTTRSSVYDIRTGRSFGWLPDLEPDDPSLMLGLRIGGMSYYEIAKKFETRPSTAERVVESLAESQLKERES